MEQKTSTSRKNKLVIFFSIVLILGISGVGIYFLWNNTKNAGSDEKFSERVLPETNMDGLSFYDTKEENMVTDQETKMPYVNNEIIVTLSTDGTEEELTELLQEYGAQIVGRNKVLNRYQVQFDSLYTYTEIEEIGEKLQDNNIISDTSVNLVMEGVTPEYYPESDKEWKNKWVNKWWWPFDGNNWGVKAIDAPGAWEYRDQMESVNVGVWEPGIFYTSHDDLKFAENPFMDEGIPLESKNKKHATNMAGIIAAGFDNDCGISGIVPKRKLYGAVFTSSDYTEYEDDIALTYLIEKCKCKVINASFGWDDPGFAASRDVANGKEEESVALNYIQKIAFHYETILKKLMEKGNDFVICTGAGNSNSTDLHSNYSYRYFKCDEEDVNCKYGYYNYQDYLDFLNNNTDGIDETIVKGLERYRNRRQEIEKRLDYGNVDAKYDGLAAIEDEEVKNRIIVVGAVENKGFEKYDLIDYSQCGDRVDVVAPGKGILTTTNPEVDNCDYSESGGTSSATAHVSGVAALCYSVNPDLKGDQVKQIIVETATGAYGEEKYGLVNAKKAVERALTEPIKETEPTMQEETTQEVQFEEEISAADTSTFSTCGYVLKVNDDLYYMRFTLDSMDYEMQLKTTSVIPVSEGTYDLVCRHSDGTEEVIDQLTGYNQMGLANEYLFYSRKEDGSDYVYGINMKTGEKIHLEKGTLVDANGYAIVYQDAQKRLHGFGSKGEDNILPYEKYLGMEGDWIYTCKIDNGGERFDESGDVSIAKVNQANLDKKELAHITAPVNSDSSRDTVFSCFKTDQGDTYYSFVYKYGRFGFLLDGPIYRLRDGASEPELLVEEAGGDFQIRKADGKTYLAFYQFKKEENGDMATYMMDVETGEIVDTMYQDLVAIQGESAHWNEKGVYAVLDGTGEQSVLLTNDQLQQLGFTEYNNSHANKESIFSVQDDGVYLYLCYGEEQQDIDGTVLATFHAEYGMLIRTNPDTGELIVIYEMTKQEQDTKETTFAGYDWLLEPSLDADDIIVYDGTRGYQGTFQTDLSIMVQNGKYGIVDANGQVLVPCEYEKYNLCTCGMVSINDEMGMEVTIGADGLRYTNFEGHGVAEKYHENQDYITLENPYFSDNNCSAVKRDGKWGYQDSNGKEILPCMFNELHINWVDPNRGFTQYQPVFSFSENLVAVATDKGAGYYDIDGNEIIPCGEFEQARPVHDGKAWVKKNGKWGIIHIQYEYTGTKVTYAHASESKMENMTPYKREDSIQTDVVASGTCGDNATWKLDGQGTLTISGKGSIEANDSATYGSIFRTLDVRNVAIEQGITDLGKNAFAYCENITNITIPNSVISIGDFAFDGCEHLTNIIIPESVTSIGGHAFSRCHSLTSITIPNSVTSIGEFAFCCRNLTSITIPDSVTHIGQGAFSGCSSLTSIIIPNSVTSIGDYMFSGCESLLNVTIPNSITSIGEDAFEGCMSLKDITIPNSVTSIGDYAFRICSSLEHITIPNSVTSIEMDAFEYCSSLKEITIPSSVTYMGPDMFEWCDSLETIYVQGYTSKPDGWDPGWLGTNEFTICNATVVWGER